jgi:lysozyme
LKTSTEGIAILHHFESCRLKAYPDPATGGEPYTIGYGHTGPEVHLGLVWTQEQADAAFADRLAREFEPGVWSMLRVGVTQYQFDALVCLAYNIGLGNLGKSTLIRKLNTPDAAGASEQFLVWNRAAGQVMRGLTRRRYAERARFNGDDAKQAIAVGMAAA